MHQGTRLAKTTEEVIQTHVSSKSYEIALTLIGQLRKEIGELSIKNEITCINCLYQTGRYLEALEIIKRLIDEGMESKELYFFRGLCLYQLCNYSDAAKDFHNDPSWFRWEQKAIYMDNVRKRTNSIHTIGEARPPIALSNIKQEWYQSNDYITVTIFAKGLSKEMVNVSFYEYAFDIVIKAGSTSALTKSIELYDSIIPTASEIKVTPIKIELKMKKAKPTKWPCLDADINLGNKTLDKKEVLSQLVEIDDLTDAEAAKMFERTQNEGTTKLQYQWDTLANL